MYILTPASLLPLLRLTLAFPQPLQALTSRTYEAEILTPSAYYQVYEEPTFHQPKLGPRALLPRR